MDNKKMKYFASILLLITMASCSSINEVKHIRVPGTTQKLMWTDGSWSEHYVCSCGDIEYSRFDSSGNFIRRGSWNLKKEDWADELDKEEIKKLNP